MGSEVTLPRGIGTLITGVIGKAIVFERISAHAYYESRNYRILTKTSTERNATTKALEAEAASLIFGHLGIIPPDAQKESPQTPRLLRFLMR